MDTFTESNCVFSFLPAFSIGHTCCSRKIPFGRPTKCGEANMKSQTYSFFE